MLETFIKNKGVTKTIIHKNNKNYYNEMNWDADYDGEKANITLEIDENGSKGHIEMKMNNDDLAELLNIPSVNKTIDKRLYSDFLGRNTKHEDQFQDKIFQIYMKPKSIIHNKFNSVKDSYEKHKKRVHFGDNQVHGEHGELEGALETLLNENTPEKVYTHISSPTSQEELLFPLKLSHKHSNRNHKKPKTHVTYKVHRKSKTSPHSSNSKSLKRKNRGHRHSYSRRTF